LINKCCKDGINCEKIVSKICCIDDDIDWIYICDDAIDYIRDPFIEIIKINNNNLIYHRLRAEIYKILLDNILMIIYKNITFFVHGELCGKYVDNDISYNLQNKEYLCKNYIAKNISVDDIRIQI
jgi:hypothetical protein